MASPWTNDDNISKKRTSTLKRPKPRAFLPTIGEPDEYTTREPYQNQQSTSLQPTSLDSLQNDQSLRNKRVDDLLNKITSIDEQQENNQMGSFKPPENPIVQLRQDINKTIPTADGGVSLPSYLDATQKMRKVAANNFSADNRGTTFSNYQQSYEMTPMLSPYFAKGTGNGDKMPFTDSKLMEKINYMIHMLEAQQSEKTSHITEEFILYTFLGIFIIYIVDSFARAGKYTR